MKRKKHEMEQKLSDAMRARALARKILANPRYLAFVEKRLLNGTLDPMIEVELMHLAFGPPLPR